jgi:RNA polymerase sigma-70 factor (ECF subfamily)
MDRAVDDEAGIERELSREDIGCAFRSSPDKATTLGRKLGHAALRIVGPDDAEDLVQRTWEELLKNIDRGSCVLEGDVWETIRRITWVILRNKGHSLLRSRYRALRKQAALLDDAPSSAPLPDEDTARRRASNLVNAVLEELDPAFREVIRLQDVCGLTEQETAVQLDLPRGTVKSRTHRGRQKLRIILERKGVTSW